MYSPKVDEAQVQKLAKLRSLNEVLTGKRKPMTLMVKEAVEEYLKKQRSKIMKQCKGQGVTEASLKVMELEEKN